MYRNILLLICGLLGSVSLLHAQKLVKAGMGYSSTSVNTAIFRTNSVTSKGNMQFIAYYDEDGYLTLGKRRLGNDRFEILRSPYKGKCEDAHNVISIGIDGKGYLHVAFNHHNAPLQYCKSVEAYSLRLDTLQSMLGKDERKVTYPEFYTLKNGDLLFAYRLGKSGQGNLVLNRYDVRKGQWKRLQDTLIDGEGQRNAYWQMCVDRKGSIHVSWVWRETSAVETNHDLCYACSKDGGITWQKSTGERYHLPINVRNAEYAFKIPQKSELINQTSMATDKEGNPFIAAYWKEPGDACPQYRLVFIGKENWQMVKVADRHQPAAGIAVQRAVPGQRFRFVSAGENQPAVLVGKCHQQLPADTSLQVLRRNPFDAFTERPLQKICFCRYQRFNVKFLIVKPVKPGNLTRNFNA